jgi:hypothetical protein
MDTSHIDTNLTQYRNFKEVSSPGTMQRMIQGDDGWRLPAIRESRPEPDSSGALEEEFHYLLGTTAIWP